MNRRYRYNRKCKNCRQWHPPWKHGKRGRQMYWCKKCWQNKQRLLSLRRAKNRLKFDDFTRWDNNATHRPLCIIMKGCNGDPEESLDIVLFDIYGEELVPVFPFKIRGYSCTLDMRLGLI